MVKVEQDPSLTLVGPAPSRDDLAAENVSLRLLLTQAKLSVQDMLAQAGIEAKEREASDKLHQLILEELHHRIKNTLATVSAITSQSLRNVPSAEHAQHAIAGRLLALGRAHDLLLQARWTGTDLRTLIRSAIEPFDDPDVARISFQGPDVQIGSDAVIAIAMTLNELCTNTTKFGALSVPDGEVKITWAIDQPALRLHFTWTEQGGPKVRAPSRQSFGTRLIETLGRQLKGNVDLTYAPSGFMYTLDIPLMSLAS